MTSVVECWQTEIQFMEGDTPGFIFKNEDISVILFECTKQQEREFWSVIRVSLDMPMMIEQKVLKHKGYMMVSQMQIGKPSKVNQKQ